MLEVSTRPWLYELTQKYGRSITTLNAIPDAELDSIAAMGIETMYFMGIWELGLLIFLCSASRDGLIFSKGPTASTLIGPTLAN